MADENTTLVKANIPALLVHSPKDNVAVAVIEGLAGGTLAHGVVTSDDTAFEIAVTQDVPIGHKIALKDLKAGDNAIKYGQDIGLITADVARGQHVHVHNLKTKRW